MRIEGKYLLQILRKSGSFEIAFSEIRFGITMKISEALHSRRSPKI